ncbi:MAG: hypothetical protein ABI337_01585 [Nitrososphaera sp.]
MPQNSDIVRTTINWSKKDRHTLEVINQVRGRIPMSRVVQRCLRYLVQTGPETLRNIIQHDYFYEGP